MVKHTFCHQVEPLISGCYSNHFQRGLWLFWILSLYYHSYIFIFISNMIWLVVWNIMHFSIYIGNNHPNSLSHFSEGLKPPTSDPTLFFFQISPGVHIADEFGQHLHSVGAPTPQSDGPFMSLLHKKTSRIYCWRCIFCTHVCVWLYIYVLYLCMIDVDIPEPDTKSNRW